MLYRENRITDERKYFSEIERESEREKKKK